jgi:hypothetical protein
MVYLGKWNLEAANQDILLEMLLMIGNSNIIYVEARPHQDHVQSKERNHPTHPPPTHTHHEQKPLSLTSTKHEQSVFFCFF